MIKSITDIILNNIANIENEYSEINNKFKKEIETLLYININNTLSYLEESYREELENYKEYKEKFKDLKINNIYIMDDDSEILYKFIGFDEYRKMMFEKIDGNIKRFSISTSTCILLDNQELIQEKFNAISRDIKLKNEFIKKHKSKLEKLINYNFESLMEELEIDDYRE